MLLSAVKQRGNYIVEIYLSIRVKYYGAKNIG